MLVYHFINKEYGLQALENRRLKISRINELNDPFEFLGLNLSNKEIRSAFIRMKAKLSESRGIICFSEGWENPVLWSHYADKHKGLCLGFEIPDEYLRRVEYVGERLSDQVYDVFNLTEKQISKILTTKFTHWSYEAEWRLYSSLDEPDRETGLYFSDFGDNLKLKMVIVGAEAKITRSELSNVLSDVDVESFKARAAYKEFKVVKNQNQKLWK